MHHPPLIGHHSERADVTILISKKGQVTIRERKKAAASAETAKTVLSGTEKPHSPESAPAEIVVHCKCQIRLSAAEVKDGKLPVSRKFRKHVFNKFKKPIDLTKFIIARMRRPIMRWKRRWAGGRR